MDTGYTFNLHYDVFHVQSFYNNDKKRDSFLFFKPCVLKYEMDGLRIYDYKCSYNQYTQSNNPITPTINTPPFVSYIPIIPRAYAVIDGNHRVSATINKNVKKFSASLILPDFTPMFFMSSAEIAAFLFLKDICTIEESNMLSNNIIKNSLIIYKDSPVVNILKEQKRLK